MSPLPPPPISMFLYTGIVIVFDETSILKHLFGQKKSETRGTGESFVAGIYTMYSVLTRASLVF